MIKHYRPTYYDLNRELRNRLRRADFNIGSGEVSVVNNLYFALSRAVRDTFVPTATRATDSTGYVELGEDT